MQELGKMERDSTFESIKLSHKSKPRRRILPTFVCQG